MPDEPPSPPVDARQLGRQMACEGILRSRFGQRPCGAADRVIEVLRRESATPAVIRFPGTFRLSPRIRLGHALAASLALLGTLGVWIFGPRMGEPVLAEVTGGVRLERIGQPPAAVSAGTRLLPGDMLVTDTNATAALAFDQEQTRFDLGAGTELRLASLRSGKRFDLRAGRLEADVARQRPFAPLIIQTPNAEARVLGTRFTLMAAADSTLLEVEHGRVQITAGDGRAAKVRSGESTRVAAGVELSVLPRTGLIRHDRWTNGVAGALVNDLFEDPRFPDRPSSRATLDKLQVVASPGRDGGGRVAGYVHPPITGDYVFFISGTIEGIFRLSRDTSPDNALQVFGIEGPQDADWSDRPSRRSTPRRLVAGRRYFIECVYRNGSNGGRIAVAWQPPGGERAVIGGEYLSPLNSVK